MRETGLACTCTNNGCRFTTGMENRCGYQTGYFLCRPAPSVCPVSLPASLFVMSRDQQQDETVHTFLR